MSDLNDPRVFFAAERTLLAWSRTALALMAFGFAIERFALFVAMLGNQKTLNRVPVLFVLNLAVRETLI